MKSLCDCGESGEAAPQRCLWWDGSKKEESSGYLRIEERDYLRGQVLVTCDPVTCDSLGVQPVVPSH